MRVGVTLKRRGALDDRRRMSGRAETYLYEGSPLDRAWPLLSVHFCATFTSLAVVCDVARILLGWESYLDSRPHLYLYAAVMAVTTLAMQRLHRRVTLQGRRASQASTSRPR